MRLTSPDGSLTIRPVTEDDITPNYVGWLNDQSLMRYSNQRFINHTLATSRSVPLPSQKPITYFWLSVTRGIKWSGP